MAHKKLIYGWKQSAFRKILPISHIKINLRKKILKLFWTQDGYNVPIIPLNNATFITLFCFVYQNVLTQKKEINKILNTYKFCVDNNCVYKTQ